MNMSKRVFVPEPQISTTRLNLLTLSRKKERTLTESEGTDGLFFDVQWGARGQSNRIRSSGQEKRAHLASELVLGKGNYKQQWLLAEEGCKPIGLWTRSSLTWTGDAALSVGKTPHHGCAIKLGEELRCAIKLGEELH